MAHAEPEVRVYFATLLASMTTAHPTPAAKSRANACNAAGSFYAGAAELATHAGVRKVPKIRQW
jgi:hypothetical protein